MPVEFNKTTMAVKTNRNCTWRAELRVDSRSGMEIAHTRGCRLSQRFQVELVGPFLVWIFVMQGQCVVRTQNWREGKRLCVTGTFARVKSRKNHG